MRAVQTGYPTMHFAMCGLCALAAAAATDCSQQSKSGNNLWVPEGQGLLDKMFAAYLIDDGSSLPIVVEMQQDCDATYVLCPAIEPTVMATLILGMAAEGKVRDLYKTANRTTPSYYHTNILKGFARKVRSGVNATDYDGDQKYLQSTFPVDQTSNYQYFTFKGASDGTRAKLDSPGLFARYGGGDFDFRPDQHPYQLISLYDDPYMKNWVWFYAHFRHSSEDTAIVDAQLNDFANRAYVSTSLDLCWSMLVTGFLHNMTTEPEEPSMPVPNVRAHASVWQSKECTACGEHNGAGVKSVPCQDSLPQCKADCLLAKKGPCVGVLYDTKGQQGLLMNPYISYSRTSGSYDTWLQLDVAPTGLSFNRDGTQTQLSYKLSRYAYSVSGNLARSVLAKDDFTLARCQGLESRKCFVTATNGTFTEDEYTGEPSAAVRIYTRVENDTPGRCEAHCFLNMKCLAWTWDASGCEIVTNVGPASNTARVPNMAVFDQLNLSPTHNCNGTDQAFDYCAGVCVNIHNPLEMGWCNHNWVACQGGKYKDYEDYEPEIKGQINSKPSLNTSSRICVGGLMPDLPGVAFTPLDWNHANEENFQFDDIPNANKAALHRANVQINGNVGAYRTDGLCGDLGASLSTNVITWAKWRETYLASSNNPGADTFNRTTWDTEYMGNGNNFQSLRTYITAVSQSVTGSNTEQIDNDATLFPSFTSGIDKGSNFAMNKRFTTGDCRGVSGDDVCVFPTCMYKYTNANTNAKTTEIYFDYIFPGTSSSPNCKTYDDSCNMCAQIDGDCTKNLPSKHPNLGNIFVQRLVLNGILDEATDMGTDSLIAKQVEMAGLCKCSTTIEHVFCNCKSTAKVNGEKLVKGKGFMCPVGVLVQPQESLRPSTLPLPATPPTPATWHPYAQLTAKCPANKPIRCSKLSTATGGNDGRGICQYGFDWKSKQKQRYDFGGRASVLDSWSDVQPLINGFYTQYAAVPDRTKCNIYDHACYSVQEAAGSDEDICEKNNAGSICGAKINSKNDASGFCGIAKGKPAMFTSKNAQDQCKKWPSGSGRLCNPGYSLVWSGNQPWCRPATAANKIKSGYDNPFPPELFSQKGDTKGQPYWPGFSVVEDAQSFAGVGPGYASKFDSCTSNATCNGFDLCGKPPGGYDASCLREGLTHSQVVTQCCTDTESIRLSKLDGQVACQATPSAVCAGGNHLVSKDLHCKPAPTTLPCNCCEEKCTSTTRLPHAQTDLVIQASTHTGHTATLKELYAELADTITGLAVNAASCGGPEARLAGTLWKSETKTTKPGSCACTQEKQYTVKNSNSTLPVFKNNQTQELPIGKTSGKHLLYTVPTTTSEPPTTPYNGTEVRPRACDPTVSCAYGSPRLDIDAFTDSSYKTGNIGFDSSLLCNDYKTTYDAKSACIAFGKQCIGIAMKTDKQTWCIQTPENEFDSQKLSNTYSYLLKRHSGNVSQRVGFEKNLTFPANGLLSGKHEFANGFDTGELANYCMMRNDCLGIYFNITHGSGYYVSNKGTSTSSTTKGLYYSKQSIPSNRGSCSVPGYPYAYDRDGKVGSGCCSSPAITCSGKYGPYVFDQCDTSSTACNFPPCLNYDDATTCPPHKPCANGKSVLDAATHTCQCVCDAYWNGTLCDSCTRGNTDPSDCTTCLPNFIMEDDLCICRHGFDLASNCTTCMDGFAGDDCQTATCSYKLGASDHAESTASTLPAPVQLDNIVIAANDDSMLYDGIYAAGDGYIPLVMQNSLVHSNNTLYWLYGLERQYIRVEVTHSYLCQGPTEVYDTFSNESVFGDCLTAGKLISTKWHQEDRRNDTYRCDGFGGYHMVMDADSFNKQCSTVPNTIDVTDYDSIIHWIDGEWLNSIPLHRDYVWNSSNTSNALDSCSGGKMEVTCTHLSHCVRVIEEQMPNLSRFATESAPNDGSLTACLGNSATGPLVWTRVKGTKKSAMHIRDIITDPDAWGAVCPGRNVAKFYSYHLNTNTKNTPKECAEYCLKHPNCWSFYWKSTTCETWDKTAIAYASEYDVSPPDCVSGGFANTGPWRNLRNKPSLVMPKQSELLTRLDKCMQGPVVCAFDSNAKWVLSMYRRHPYSGSMPCSTRVDATWLYSLPRGTANVNPHNALEPCTKDFAFLRAPGTLVVPDTVLAVTSEHSTRACCEACGGTGASVLSYTGTECRCYKMELDKVDTGPASVCLRYFGGRFKPGSKVPSLSIGQPCSAQYMRDKTGVYDCHDGKIRFKMSMNEINAYCKDVGFNIYNNIPTQKKKAPSCWVPVQHDDTMLCNRRLTMVNFTSGSVNTEKIDLHRTLANVTTAAACSDACLSDTLCRISEIKSGLCYLYAFLSRAPDTHENIVQQDSSLTVYVKLGGCVSNGTMCVYKGDTPSATAIPLSVCSANGASHAIAASAKLFYGHSTGPDTISTLVNHTCSSNQSTQFNALAMRTNTALTALKTVDTELLYDRFRSFLLESKSTLTSNLIGLNETGLFQVLPGDVNKFPESPKQSKPCLTAQGSVNFEISKNRYEYSSFDLAQSYSLPPHTLVRCDQQAALASNLVGDLDSRTDSVCYSIGTCAQPIYTDTRMQDRVLRAYLLQQKECQSAIGWQSDTKDPVPAIVYVQPPYGWSAYMYQGLPTYRVSTSKFGTTSAISPFLPVPLPTPEPTPPVAQPTPTPSSDVPTRTGVITTNNSLCTFDTYSGYNVKDPLSIYLLPLNASNYAVNVNGTTACAEKCANALLCRFYTNTSSSDCNMWALSHEALIESSFNYFEMPAQNCAVQTGFWVNNQGTTKPKLVEQDESATLAVKQSCCFVLDAVKNE